TLQPVKIAIAPSDPSTLYVSIGMGNVWKTQNAWEPVPIWIPLPNIGTSDPPQAMRLIVDPTNAEILYLASIPFLCGFDGTTWVNKTETTHVDQWALAWAGSQLLLGNDGGIWGSMDGGTTWLNHNTNLSITQFYDGSLHPT